MRTRSMILLLLAAVSALAAAPFEGIDYDQWMYIGNYRSKPTAEMNEHRVGVSEGIYVTGYRSAWGIVEPNPRLAAEISSPNFFAVSPDKKVLYTCTTGPEVDAFAVDAKTGDLTLINKARGNEGARGYCHVAVSPDGRAMQPRQAGMRYWRACLRAALSLYMLRSARARASRMLSFRSSMVDAPHETLTAFPSSVNISVFRCTWRAMVSASSWLVLGNRAMNSSPPTR